LITPNWSLRLSSKWSLLPDRRRGCCLVPLEDERAAQTIGAVTEDPCRERAKLFLLGARSSKDAESRLK